MQKPNGDDAATIKVNPEPFAFEAEQKKNLARKAAAMARRGKACYRKRFDTEEVVAAALPGLYHRYSTAARRFRELFHGREMTIKQRRHDARCAKAVHTAIVGGDIGNGRMLPPDLAVRKLGYHPILKPWNAESYADFYKLPPCGQSEERIILGDLKNSPLVAALFGGKLGDNELEQLRWLLARAAGASLSDAAKACGKRGSEKAIRSWSERLAASLRHRAEKAGARPDCDDGSLRQFARPLPTRIPKDEDDWREAVISVKII